MILEETILDLTSRTPSGGSCRIEKASFIVWYCADIWEWEYQGETYFDALDLAEAMNREIAAIPQRGPRLPHQKENHGEALQCDIPTGRFFAGPHTVA